MNVFFSQIWSNFNDICAFSREIDFKNLILVNLTLKWQFFMKLKCKPWFDGNFTFHTSTTVEVHPYCWSMYHTYSIWRGGIKFLPHGYNFFPAQRSRKGKKFYPLGRNFISSPPDWVGKAFLCNSNSKNVIFREIKFYSVGMIFNVKYTPAGRYVIPPYRFHKNFVKIHSRGGVHTCPYQPTWCGKI